MRRLAWLFVLFCFSSLCPTSLWQLQKALRTAKCLCATMRILMLRYVICEFWKATAFFFFFLPICYGILSLQGWEYTCSFTHRQGEEWGENNTSVAVLVFLIKISSIGHNKLSIPPIHQNNTQHPEWGFCSRFVRNDNTRSLEGSSSLNEASNFS